MIPRYIARRASRLIGQNARIKPLEHLSEIGQEKDRDPLPSDRATRRRTRVAPHFDVTHYRQAQIDIPDIERYSDDELLSHYLERGWREGRNPNENFSVTRYLQAYVDVAKAEVEPFFHFLTYGKKGGRAPWPSAPDLDHALDVISDVFDPDYYRAQKPELAHLDNAALTEHYHLHGWRQGGDPSLAFSVNAYLERYPDVARAMIDPLWHYLTAGQWEGRQTSAAAPLRFADLSEDNIQQMLEIFEPDFYRSQCPNAPRDVRDALRHYVDHGWREGYDPSPAFSTVFYRETYKLPPRLCPLTDYVSQPVQAGRKGNEDQPVRLLRRASARPESPALATLLDAKRLATQAEVSSLKTADPKAMDLHWIVPDFGPGGGGHMTIFRMIRYLENAGHRVTVWIDRPTYHGTTAAAYDTIVKHFQCIEAQIRFVEDGFYESTGDAVIATAWGTAYVARAATGFAEKFYFVQDHEPEFYPTGADRILAKRTYEFELACICASPWLDEMMRTRYGRWSRSFHLGYDHTVYHPAAGRPNWPAAHRVRRRIAVYGRMHTARRCVELALAGLQVLATRRDDFEVHFFGQDKLPFTETSFEAYNHGVLDAPALAALYTACDVGLCFSATNYSLVPQEMMACELPLVELDGESTRAIYPDGVVTLADVDPHDVAAQIERLLDDPEACRTQAAQASEWVTSFTWQRAGRDVECAILERLGELGKLTSETPGAPAISKSLTPLIDVVIPTYNGLGEIEQVIQALRGQSTVETMQIHCIDSSSSDGTTEWLREQQDIALTVIDQSDFQHGRTRNQGAGQGEAPIIAFLTQDAVPASADWGRDILKMMRHFPEAAGLFGRHLPYPHHPLSVQREIEQHFRRMLDYPLALSKDTDPIRWERGDLGWRQFLHFYSDNNSAMRRTIWNDYPYPEIDYGEDQVWAKTIIEAGLTKLYAPTATVYHSHDYSPAETYKRAKIEAAFFHTHFGYEIGSGTEAEIEERVSREQAALSAWALRHGISNSERELRLAIISEKHRGWRDGLAEARPEIG